MLRENWPSQSRHDSNEINKPYVIRKLTIIGEPFYNWLLELALCAYCDGFPHGIPSCLLIHPHVKEFYLFHTQETSYYEAFCPD